MHIFLGIFLAIIVLQGLYATSIAFFASLNISMNSTMGNKSEWSKGETTFILCSTIALMSFLCLWWDQPQNLSFRYNFVHFFHTLLFLPLASYLQVSMGPLAVKMGANKGLVALLFILTPIYFGVAWNQYWFPFEHSSILREVPYAGMAYLYDILGLSFGMEYKSGVLWGGDEGVFKGGLGLLIILIWGLSVLVASAVSIIFGLFGKVMGGDL